MADIKSGIVTVEKDYQGLFEIRLYGKFIVLEGNERCAYGIARNIRAALKSGRRMMAKNGK